MNDLKKTRENILLASQEILANSGYAGFSLGAIADRLQISKGVVTYHFSQKELLIQTLVTAYFHDASEYMGKHMIIDQPAPVALKSYIESNLRYVADNRIPTLALIQIIANHRNNDGSPAFSDKDSLIFQPLIEIFRYGQLEEQSFGSFSPELMALFVRSVIDSLSGRIATNEIEDVEGAIEETIRAFALATRRV